MALAIPAGMSQPRCIVPGRTYLVTRRTTRRSFVLRPDADGTTQNAYWYLTAVLANAYGIVFHAVQMMSTHMHEVLTDTRGELPRFLQERNRLFANVLKVHRDWDEEVFARGAPHLLLLRGPAAILQEIGYTMANCVEAGLVEKPESWPGVSAVAGASPRVVSAQRPRMYLDPENPRWPEEASLTLTVPVELSSAFGDGAADLVREAVRSAVGKARAAIVEAGRRFAQAATLTSVPPETRATTPVEERKRMPNFAAAGVHEEIERAARERSLFMESYYAALQRVKDGLRDVLFPAGTWRACVELGFARARHPAASWAEAA